MTWNALFAVGAKLVKIRMLRRFSMPTHRNPTFFVCADSYNSLKPLERFSVFSENLLT